MSVPVAQIPGTNLWTGIWYLVDLKANGRLTWANKKANTGHHVQTASGPEFKKYESGGVFWNDGHWMIIPAPEKPGYYLLKNKTKTDSVMTWEGQSSTTKTSKWAVLIEGGADYDNGGRYRKDALWRFDPGTDSSYYQLRNFNFQDNGVLTWSGADTGINKTNWCQVTTTGSEGNNKSDGDYLWAFTSVDPLPTPSIFGNRILAPIPGTDLWTGVWYLIDLKSPNGRLTWANKKANTGHHVQVAFGAELEKYKEGGPFWNDGHWMIFQAPEKPNHYLLKNKTKDNAVITWEGQSSTWASSKWAVAIEGQDKSSDYGVGGKFRTDALWRIEGTDGAYQLLSASFPASGTLTWSSADTGYTNTHWCQVVTEGESGKYKTNNEYLWGFTSAEPLPAECVTIATPPTVVHIPGEVQHVTVIQDAPTIIYDYVPYDPNVEIVYDDAPAGAEEEPF